MSQYNYTETKEELLEVELENPNPLPRHYFKAFKNLMLSSHNLNLDDQEVKEIHDFLESAKVVDIATSERGSKDLEFTLRSGKVERFNKSGSDFIRAMFDFTPEVKIRITGLKEADMETYIEEEREYQSREFAKFFKNKDYESRETGEPVNWDDMFQDFYSDYDLPKATTTTKIVSSIKSGKMKLAAVDRLIEAMLNEVFIREKE